MPVAPDLCGCALDGRYELHEMIGEGAFGRVYRGLDRRLARPVAVKVIKPWWADDPEWVETFEREAQLLARVSDPGIVQIFDVGHADEGLYYVSELVEGESLAGRLRHGPLAPSDAVALAEQLCRALAQAHAQRIIHRDVKPANILISAHGRVKIGDFGVARLAEGTTDGNGSHPATIVGTPRYMAPEQGRGLPTSPATDVYSVGVVLYEMLAGVPPFSGSSMVELALSHDQDQPPPLPPGTPRALSAIVARALAKAPADRYRDAGEMAAALAAASSEAPPRRPRSRPNGTAGARATTAATSSNGADRTRRLDRTRPAPPTSPRRRWNPAARRRTVALFGLVLALIAAMLAGAALLGGQHRTRVPNLAGLTRTDAAARATGSRLRVNFHARYDPAAPGTVIAQSPAAGRQVSQGSVLRVELSRGLAPVRLPDLRGKSGPDAQLILSQAGLSSTLVAGPDPGQRPGTVYGQKPAGGVRVRVPAHSQVTLSVAETPRWRSVTSFSGTGAARSVSFTIRGSQWRIRYSMQFQGACAVLFFSTFCSGPTARTIALQNGATVDTFGLQDGQGQTRTLHTGSGTYQLQITPGNSASYRVQVQDDY